MGNKFFEGIKSTINRAKDDIADRIDTAREERKADISMRRMARSEARLAARNEERKQIIKAAEQKTKDKFKRKAERKSALFSKRTVAPLGGRNFFDDGTKKPPRFI